MTLWRSILRFFDIRFGKRKAPLIASVYPIRKRPGLVERIRAEGW